MPKNCKAMKNGKLRNKVSKLISKYDRKNSKQEKILKLSKNTQKQLKALLKEIPKEGKEFNPELSDKLTDIHKEFKSEMKRIKMECKKQRKEYKNEKKGSKRNKKEEKLNLKESRIDELPELKENDLSELSIIIDGWNIVGCDKIARKSMRGKRGKGGERIIDLLSNFGLLSNYMKSNGENVKLIIHFDGKGKSEVKVFETLKIDVKYSGKSEIVDDRLVRELSINVKNNDLTLNRQFIVITSDKELSLRLNKIGVKCMKSGVFYKKYLKEFKFCGLNFEEKESKNKKNGKNGKNKYKKRKEKKSKKGRKHWKKYIKNKFSDNSTTSNTSNSDSNSGFSSNESSGFEEIEDITPTIIE